MEGGGAAGGSDDAAAEGVAAGDGLGGLRVACSREKVCVCVSESE